MNAGSVTINGQSINCSGSMSIVNGKMMYCEGSGGISVTSAGAVCSNGKAPRTEASAGSSGPCGGSKSVTHSNGGGVVDSRATVPADVFVASTATICGQTVIGSGSRVEAGATLNGQLKIGKNVKIGKDASLNGQGTLGDSVTVEEGASLNGSLNIRNSVVKKGASLNGNIILKDIPISKQFTYKFSSIYFQ